MKFTEMQQALNEAEAELGRAELKNYNARTGRWNDKHC